jgi:hypothetical protein
MEGVAKSKDTCERRNIDPVGQRRPRPPVPPRLRRLPITPDHPDANNVVGTVKSPKQTNIQCENSSQAQWQSNNPFRARLPEQATRSPFQEAIPTRSTPETVQSRTSAAVRVSREVFIGVVGVTGSGKSTFIKRVTSCGDDDIVAHGLRAGSMPGLHHREC